ncbi:ABC transporter permease [Patescibacteria group bacterium]|nr:ABC transporter permease [Patescibacteria group bacterium]MCL5091285.1 ABC transporter permease [Patescibacteria group bacterium]
MFTLYKKELGYYLNNALGYIVLILFAVFANFLFVKDIFVVGSASLGPLFDTLPWLMLIFVPALVMRAFAEEKRTNTLEVLLTLPLTETEIVMAKFFALLTWTTIGIALTFGLPVSLSLLTKLYYPGILVGYLGQILLVAALVSVALFISALTKNQVTAFLISVVALFCLLVLGSDFFAALLPKFIQDNLLTVTPLYHLQNFTKGVIDLRSLFYFVSLTAVFLFLTVVDLEKRR